MVPAVPPDPGPVRRGLRRRKRWLLLATGLACAVLTALAAVASRYQPIGYGDVGNSLEAFPGLPTGRGIHPVNNLGGLHEDMYIPAQRGTFSLFADITNNGSHPVTILSASLPGLSPFRLAGPARYSVPGMGGTNEIPPPVSRVLRGAVLLPGEQMFLGFPVRMWPCAVDDEWVSIPTFSVRFRYLLFTRTVAVPWGWLGDSLLVHAPGGRPGHKGVTCAPGTTAANLPRPAT